MCLKRPLCRPRPLRMMLLLGPQTPAPIRHHKTRTTDTQQKENELGEKPRVQSLRRTYLHISPLVFKALDAMVFQAGVFGHGSVCMCVSVVPTDVRSSAQGGRGGRGVYRCPNREWITQLSRIFFLNELVHKISGCQINNWPTHWTAPSFLLLFFSSQKC